MAETLTLTTPETKPSNTKYDIAGIYETWLPVGRESVEIRLVDQFGEVKIVRYGPEGLMGTNGAIVPGSPTGQAILKAQNKMDFSGAKDSRQKRIYKQLNTDGILIGTVTGTPD